MSLTQFNGLKDLAIIFIAVPIILILNHAGGHIFAPVVAIMGAVGVLGLRLNWKLTSPLLLAGLGLFVWILASSIWSDYQDGRDFKNIYRFAIGIPLYIFAIYWFSKLSPERTVSLRKLSGVLIPLSALIFAIETLTNYGVTRLADPSAVVGNIEANLSHGISALMVLAIPALLIIWSNDKIDRLRVFVLATSLVICAFFFGNTASLIAVFILIPVMLFASRRPSLCFATLSTIIGIGIILSPLIAVYAASIDAAGKASLPFSWEWRLETWSYIHENMYDRVFFGHGFDALRAVNETFDSRGFEDLAVVPMHAHNLGLHIWYELGLFGVLMTNLCLFLAARSVARSSLTRPQIMGLCGVTTSAAVYSALSYSPWSDWWLAAIAFAIGMVFLIPNRTTEWPP